MITQVAVHAPPEVNLAALARMFPAVAVARTDRAALGAVDGRAWREDAFDFWAFDRRLDQLADRHAPLVIDAMRDTLPVVREILTRAQRVSPRRTIGSMTPWFRALLLAHRALHDLTKPLVRSDYDHAVDAWQWAQRMNPAVSLEIQLAALCHDLERLLSEPDVRREHLAPDYQAFKDAHAASGAKLAGALFDRAGVPAHLARRAKELIAHHERAGADPDVRALNDADALSFFSFNSHGYLRYFGPEHTARKVRYTLARMSPAAQREIGGLRIPAAIRGQLAVLRATSTRSTS